MNDEQGDGEGIVTRAVRVTTPQAKQANVKRILRRALCEATDHLGKNRVIGVFLVTVTEGGEAGLGYAMTVDEAALLAQAAETGMERALAVVRAASKKQ
jgi:hypothetical protein